MPGADPVNVGVADLFENTEGTEGADFSVTSSDPSVATVEVTSNPRVKITPVGVGTATISVTAGESEASVEFDFTVAQAPDTAPRPPEVAQSNVDEVTAAAGRIVPGADPVNVGVADLFEDTEDTNSNDFRVTSSDPSVATVEITSDRQVRITPVGVGTATISASVPWSEASVEFDFTVAQAPTGGDENPDTTPRSSDTVRSNIDAAIAAAGGLMPGRDPVLVDVNDLFRDTKGTEDDDYSATSSDPAVATVGITANGPHVRITPVGVGTATIRVTGLEPEHVVEFDVTVARSVPALPLVATGLLGMLLFGAGAWRRLRRR